MSATLAAKYGAQDGALAGMLRKCKSATDDFIRRRILTEDERSAYCDAWFAAYKAAK